MIGGDRRSGAVRARRALGALSVVLALAPMALAPAQAAGGPGETAAADADLADVEAEFASLVAAERDAHGLSGLVVREDLWAVGRDHSAAMDADNAVYHNPRLAEQVQNWRVVGENVGAGRSVDAVHEALMASQTHRKVVLDPRFTEIGVGVVRSDGILWVSEVFRLPEPPGDSSPAESPASTSSSSSSSSTSAPASAPAPADDRYVAAAAPAGRTAPPGPASAPRPAPLPPAVATPEAWVPGMASSAAPATVATPSVAEAGPVPAEPPGVAGVPAGASSQLASDGYVELPAASELPGAGLLAAFLLWAVVAGLARVTTRRPGWT